MPQLFARYCYNLLLYLAVLPVWLYLLLRSRKDPAYRQRLKDVYAGLASQYKVPLLPFLLDGVALQPGLMQSDGLHPTAAAQPRVLDNVWPLLKPLL